MNFHIVIPAHNEEDVLVQTLESLVNQTLKPAQIILVNDNSTDATPKIAQDFSENYPFVKVLNVISTDDHSPGSKVVNAFYEGYNIIDEDVDIICKFDADLIFPQNYLQDIQEMFQQNPKLGIASGILHIKQNDSWVYERIADKTHVRGPIKAYRKTCFDEIGGLRASIGWDTVDVLLAQFHGWQISSNEKLIVKHLKPTGAAYQNKGYQKQGEAMFKMRYGIFITIIAALKISVIKKSVKVFVEYLRGYLNAKNAKIDYLVTSAEGKFIRKLRWNGIMSKLKLNR